MHTYSIRDFVPEAVIVDAGAFPVNPLPLSLLEMTDRVVCCDGAADRYIAAGFKPWRIVGDGDSISPETLKEYGDLVRRNPDQETNDQTKAVGYLASHGYRRIAILGATGLREDHTIGNISLLVDYMKGGIDARAYTDHGVFIPVSDTSSFTCAPGTQVSIFNFGAGGLRAEGLRYPLRDFDSWWQGTLNEAPGTEFTIHARGCYLVFLNYPKASRKER